MDCRDRGDLFQRKVISSFTSHNLNSHQTSTCVVSCFDFRVQPETAKFQKAIGVELHDPLTIPGGIKSINDSETEELMKKWLGVSYHGHNVRKFVLIAHSNCLAYAEECKDLSDFLEFLFHQNELRKAADKILSWFPDAETKLYYAFLDKEECCTKFREVSLTDPVSIVVTETTAV